MTTKAQMTFLPHAEGAEWSAFAERPSPATGCDLAAAIPANTSVVIWPNERAAIPTGLVIALPPGFEGQIRPRPGLALRHGITVLNAPATVDADYRGEVQVILINHGTRPFTVERGAHIATLVFTPVAALDCEWCDFAEWAARCAS